MLRVCVFFLGCVGLGVKSTPHDDDVAADPLSPETLRFGTWLWTWCQTTARTREIWSRNVGTAGGPDGGREPLMCGYF